MALYLIVGVPGSGKSYFAVRDIARRFYTYSGTTYTRKSAFANTPIFTNINGLRSNLPDLLDLDESLKKFPVEKFFSFHHQSKLLEHFGTPPVYIIDEAADHFPDNFKDPDVFKFFRRNRHLGIDLYLITQSIDDLPRQITRNREIALMALPRSLRLGSVMRYNVLGGRYLSDVLETRNVPFSLQYANLYKTASALESSRIKNPYVKYIALVACMLAFGLYRVANLFIHKDTLLGKNLASTVKNTSTSKSQNAPNSSGHLPGPSRSDSTSSLKSQLSSSNLKSKPKLDITFDPTPAVYSEGKYYYLDRSGRPHTLTSHEAASVKRVGLTFYLPRMISSADTVAPPRGGEVVKPPPPTSKPAPVSLDTLAKPGRRPAAASLSTSS